MNISVVGLWHLGTVTAACLAAAGHSVTGLDFDPAVVASLSKGELPLFEPGLEALVGEGLASGRLRFTADPAQAIPGADIVWIAYDTPVDDDDRADVGFVVDRVSRLFPLLTAPAIVLVSSQLPVGTTRRLEQAFAGVAAASAGAPGVPGVNVHFAYSPENLRLGGAIDAFRKADRVVVGVRHDEDRERLGALFAPFTDRIEWMTVESAEMTKHAINAFLATSVTFINEIATICEATGADAMEVARGLKSESRIGPKAYLSPGGAIAGGTLARDIQFLSALGVEHALETHLLGAVPASNRAHAQWVQRRLTRSLGSLSGLTIGVWGLTYKPGTSTLRRSSAVELCRWLVSAGAAVRAHDPAVTDAGVLPDDLAGRVAVTSTPIEAAENASAVVVATPWPDYREVNAAAVAATMQRPLVIDAGSFLEQTLGQVPGIEYITFGKGRR